MGWIRFSSVVPQESGNRVGDVKQKNRLLRSVPISTLCAFQFQWRFSRNDIHSRQTRKSKGKPSTRDKQQAEENEKNLEDQFSRAGEAGNCVLGAQQWGRASEVREQRQGSAAVQNGPLATTGTR